MTTDLFELQDLSCPVCGKPLTSMEYNHALKEISLRAGENYQEQIKKERNKSEEQIQDERKIFREKLENLTQSHKEEICILRKELASSYKQQVEDLKKNYDELDLQRQENSQKALEEKTADYKQKLYDKEAQLTRKNQEVDEIKECAIEEARVTLQKELRNKDIEIQERNIQIQRCKEDIEKLKAQLSTIQPERRGEAGEQDLLQTLREAFPEDHFTRQTRGVSEGDIIHHIKTRSGALLEIPIVYDNKEVAIVAKKEIEKQNYYKEHEGTDYLLVVSPNLPKRSIKNGILGKKDGILLVRRDIVVEIAEQIRCAIIELANTSESKKDRETKQSMIYTYITSREFARKIEGLDKIYSDMIAMQQKDEKDHQAQWKKKWLLYEQMRKTIVDISSGIDSIIHGHLPFENQTDRSAGKMDVDNGDAREEI